MKGETTKPPAYGRGGQQKRFDVWVREFNRERPHEALGQVAPATLYRRSERRYGRGEESWEYGAEWARRRVRSNGEIRWQGRLRFIGEAFRGQGVGLVEVGKGRHQVYMRDWLLGDLHEDAPGGIVPSVRAGRKAANRKVAAEEKKQVAGAGVRERAGKTVSKSRRVGGYCEARRAGAVVRPPGRTGRGRGALERKKK